MADRVDLMATGDFTEFLHELRGRELERIPADGRTVLSGGCAGGWYFDWFADRYAGSIERHIGMEAYSPRPSVLPERVEWHERTLGDLSSVGPGAVDLVFAGQTIEHLWPREIADFLCEAHRVLRPGGLMVLDSPNRLITQSLAIVQPEHTVEFAVDEIVECVELAGFDLLDIRGLWHCYDRSRRQVLPVEDLTIPADHRRRRIDAGYARPEECFVWWLEARRSERDPRVQDLERRVFELGDRFRAVAGSRLSSVIGRTGRSHADEPLQCTDPGEDGAVLYGPFIPMPPGAWRARFALGLGDGDATGTTAALLQVTVGNDASPVAERWVSTAELPPDGHLGEFVLDFDLSATTTMGLQTRVIATGAAPLVVRRLAPVAARR